MPLYRVNESGHFSPFEETPFPDLERVLEDWIETNPHLLLQGETVAFIGRQPRTAHGKFLDLLAVDETGACVIVELKRGETPREVVAQALEYAAWVDSLNRDDLDKMAGEYASARGTDARSIADLYRDTFVLADNKDEESVEPAMAHITFNNRQRLVIVAEHFSSDIEQTLRYLRTRMGIDITGLQFGVHKSGSEMIVQTSVVVGRESTAVAADKTNSGRNAGATESESDEAIAARVKSDFVRRAISSIEVWAAGNPDFSILHAARSLHTLRLRGKTQLRYYYAAQWVFCTLYSTTDAEAEFLRIELSEPHEVKWNNKSDELRLHLRTDADLHILEKLITARTAQT